MAEFKCVTFVNVMKVFGRYYQSISLRSCDVYLKFLIILLVVQLITNSEASNIQTIIRTKRYYNATENKVAKEHVIALQNKVNKTNRTDFLEPFIPNDNNISVLENMDVTQNISGWKCRCWNATSEKILECHCEGMGILRIPQTITVPVQRLTIVKAGLVKIRKTGLQVYSKTLIDISLTDVQYLESIADGAFENLNQLRTIYISHAPRLTYLGENVFYGISNTIKIIRIINSGLLQIPSFVHFPSTNIMQMLDFDNNEISHIPKRSVRIKTDQLILANNDITYIGDSAFYGSQIARLSLKENFHLVEIHANAFNGLNMQSLDLSGTSVKSLPTKGLHEIEELNIQNAKAMKTIPSIYNFKNLQRAYLTHSFHCCAFKFPSRHDPQRHAAQMQNILKWQHKCGKSRDITNAPYLFNIQAATDRNLSFNEPNESNEDLFAEYTWTLSNETDLSNGNELDNGIFHNDFVINPGQEQEEEFCGNFSFRKFDIECYPLPNALNPCEDVMGYRWLRIAVWLVVLFAIFGNMAVLLVIFSVRSENLTVPRFLMCNLAFADLCLGCYLLLIASIDAYSIGEYFNYAYDWQYGLGCKVTGFLTVFASHLSVFTLTIITLERWLAITHALHLNRRLNLNKTIKIMLCGWLFSIVMSSLPLFGISNYSSTSICLPMENSNLPDTLYLLSILGVNGITFVIISICYVHIYFSLEKKTRRHAQPGEMTIAKKMALLVFTNFFCWFPIAFFGLTALAGYPLIDVTKSKILLVFFYPLNSCADPYLYAILTAQYRKDLYELVSSVCLRRSSKYKNSLTIPEIINLTDPAVHYAARKNSRLSEKEAMFQEQHEETV